MRARMVSALIVGVLVSGCTSGGSDPGETTTMPAGSMSGGASVTTTPDPVGPTVTSTTRPSPTTTVPSVGSSTPAPSTTTAPSTPVPADPVKAGRAALERYYEGRARLLGDPGSVTAKKLFAVASSNAANTLAAQAEMWAADGKRLTGVTRIAWLKPTRVGKVSADLQVCEDISDVRLFKDSEEVQPPQTYWLATYRVEATKPGQPWTVADSERRGETCDPDGG